MRATQNRNGGETRQSTRRLWVGAAAMRSRLASEAPTAAGPTLPSQSRRPWLTWIACSNVDSGAALMGCDAGESGDGRLKPGSGTGSGTGLRR